IGPMLVMTVSSCSRTLAMPVKLLVFLTSQLTMKSLALHASGHQSAKNMPFCSGFSGPTPPINWPLSLKVTAAGRVPERCIGLLGRTPQPQWGCVVVRTGKMNRQRHRAVPAPAGEHAVDREQVLRRPPVEVVVVLLSPRAVHDPVVGVLDF